MEYRELLAKFNPSEQIILQYYSMLDEKLNAGEFDSFLMKMNLTNEGKTFNGSLYTKLRQKYIDNGILIKQPINNYLYFADISFKEFLVIKASEEDWFGTACSKIKSSYPIQLWDYTRSQYRKARDFRLAIYGQNFSYLLEKLDSDEINASYKQVLAIVFKFGLSLENLRIFPKEIIRQVLIMLANDAIIRGDSVQIFLKYWLENNLPKDVRYIDYQCTELFLQGNLKESLSVIKAQKELNFRLLSLWGLIETMNGDYASAIKIYEESLKAWRKETKKKKGYFIEWSLLGYGLALYKVKESSFLNFFQDYEKYAYKNFDIQNYVQVLGSLYAFATNNDARAKNLLQSVNINTFSVFQTFWLLIFSSNIPKASFEENLVFTSLRNAEDKGLKLVEREILFNISRKKESFFTANQADRLEKLNQEIGNIPMGGIIPVVEDWERSLSILTALGEEIEGANLLTKVAEGTQRLAWFLDFNAQEVQPIEQKMNKTGWTTGRNVALKRLKSGELKYLTSQDEKAVQIGLIEETQSGGWGYYGTTTNLYFDFEKVLPILVDHPLLFLMTPPNLPVSLVKGEVSLQVKQDKNGLKVTFDESFNQAGLMLVRETATRYKILTITPLHLKIKQSFSGKSLNIPASGKESLLKALSPLAKKMAIQSDLDEQLSDLPTVEADPKIYALITPINEGFHLELFVKPFSSTAPYMKAGKGSENLMGMVDEVRTQTKRDLKKEKENLKEVEEMCPYLVATENENHEWLLDTPDDCLQVMIELEKPKQQNKLVIEWPKGQKLKLMGNITAETLNINIISKNNWFEVSGETKVDDGLVVSLRDILQKLNGQSNFIEMSDGQYISITEKLRKHLQMMRAVLDDKMRGNILASSVFEDLSDEVKNFKADKAWKDNIKRLRDVRSVKAEIPSTFQAELRPYQEEGYQWLSQLSNWGVGACLADDMGLGKTIQALALLLQRAEKGPALVVAPLSVCRNWEKEARRFAPTLNLLVFGGTSLERKELLENAKGFDLVVVSYGLLQTEEELFKQTKFATILLDEAQAIKNRATKRSKTVMALDGDFKIITTGTPVENHLGELWNLFNFINPGLLGSHDRFNDHFAIPIERNQSLERRRALQKVIQPFILRRRKNQVLDELPAKTEIVLNVEMSSEERSFYESLRLDALERIASDSGEIQDKRFKILAELTRLRLACCNPKLVNPDIPLSSSKLELFGEVIEELLENKHKALVFSQFVKHLAIVEEYLIAKNISYQYLDGSTPAAKRQERIDDFQRGKGDVFLISLKAGGTGLNLTAADYVIHLDPWWNPAVEDQATDRAHRMGQQRPVTVYRLVTEDTVEAKILKLHETKRDLADGLLEGSEGSGKLSADQLMDLIRGI